MPKRWFVKRIRKGEVMKTAKKCKHGLYDEGCEKCTIAIGKSKYNRKK